MKTLRGCVPFLVVACLSVSLWAKGPTTRIVITAPTLAAPVEITDSKLLDAFAVWSGAGMYANDQEQSQGFIIDWRAGVVTERPAHLPRYEVAFYAKYANRPLASQQEYLAYVVSYEPDRSTGRGYLYLPGRGDRDYALNVTTIVRDREGQWFRATYAWQRAITKLLDH